MMKELVYSVQYSIAAFGILVNFIVLQFSFLLFFLFLPLVPVFPLFFTHSLIHSFSLTISLSHSFAASLILCFSLSPFPSAFRFHSSFISLFGTFAVFRLAVARSLACLLSGRTALFLPSFVRLYLAHVPCQRSPLQLTA